MNNLLNNKWAWAVLILVVINFASIGIMWMTFFKRGHDMKHHGIRHRMAHHPGGAMDNEHGDGRHDRDFLAQELQLTPEQKVSFKKLKEEHFKIMQANMKQMGELRKEVIEHVGKPEAGAEPTFQKIGALEIKNQKEAFKHFNEMYALCTDSQKVILKDRLSRVMEHPRPGIGAHKYVHRYKGMHGKRHMKCGHEDIKCTPARETGDVQKTNE